MSLLKILKDNKPHLKVSAKPVIAGSRLVSLFFDFACILIILIIGLFLIGWYTRGNLLATGYQDWINHAYRIESIETFGIPSWTHNWSNGINIWRAYPYWAHSLIVFLKPIFNLGTTQAMIGFTVSIFILIRISLYVMLRMSGCKHFASLFATTVSYCFAQQWIAISDFFVFASLVFVPPYILLWKASLSKPKYLVWLSAFTGITFNLHTVLGYSLSLLWSFAFILAGRLASFKQKTISLLVLLICALPFLIPYFGYGYNFSNPVYSSMQFIRETIVKEPLGLSLPFILIVAVTWFLVIFQTKKFPYWAKILLLFSTIYLSLIRLGLQGYYPNIIYKLQFSRAIPIVALGAIFPIAYAIKVLQKIFPSRFFYGILIVIWVVLISESIYLATRWSGQPILSVENVVNKYVQEEQAEINGEIFIASVSEATYFAPRTIRYATSYYEHLEPHPLAQRFRQLMRNELTYTGVSATQVQIINNYTQLLGVEYIFVPKVSPLVEALTASDLGELAFVHETEITSTTDTYSILKNTGPISFAYTIDQPIGQHISLEQLQKPTLEAKSWVVWDDEVEATVKTLHSEDFSIAQVEFLHPDTLKISWDATQTSVRSIFVSQSYDQNWQADIPGVTIEPTALRLMAITLPENHTGNSIQLKNSWPVWHWPIQILGFVTFGIATVATVLYLLYERHYDRK